ncbi:MAG: CpsD/CapB family tyrosine-protein kinase [Nitrospirota bacterium]
MEGLQRALERFKQQQRRPRPPDGGGRIRDTKPVPPSIVYTCTRTVDIPRETLRERRVLAGFDRGPFVDGYKVLRTQVLHRLRENGWNTVGVTSPGSGEGKTLTSVNLAISMAMEATQTVLLVDADLRRPRVHELFGLDDCAGLADYLLDDVPVEDLLIHPGIGRFVLLPGGRPLPHSAEALASPKMAALVEELKHRYPSRIIVFDLPPLLRRADVLAFSPYTDALLLVVEEGRTTAEDVEHALLLVGGAAPILGTVLNKEGRRDRSLHRLAALLSEDDEARPADKG